MSLPPFDALFHEGVRLMQEGDAMAATAALRATLALAPGAHDPACAQRRHR